MNESTDAPKKSPKYEAKPKKHKRYYEADGQDTGGDTESSKHQTKPTKPKRYYESAGQEAGNKKEEHRRVHPRGKVHKTAHRNVTKDEVVVTPVMKVARRRLQKWKERNFRQDQFPGDAPIPEDKLARYKQGAEDITVPKMGQSKKKLDKLKNDSVFAKHQAARAERLYNDEAGFLEFEEEEEREARLSQTEIAAAVDVTSAAKYFELSLKQFGPYGIDYTRNGRHLLLGGQKGHVAAFDWQTKKLHCEFNAMETVHDVKWLHQETLFATAQKSGVYVYDNQGIELHALTNLDSVLSLEFLPHHFLLVTANSKGFLCYTDVTMGTKVAGITTGLGRLDVMCQNPANAIIHLGHGWGTVTLWSPNNKNHLVKMLCHKSAVRAVTVDHTGTYMATSGVDRKLKVWDLRTYKVLANYQLSMGASSLAFSQTGILAASTGNIVQTYKDVCQEAIVKPYLSHLCSGIPRDVQFCPFEDVLGVGHQTGFSSLIIPGSGEANIDALEVNPMATKKQRNHAEVRLLLDKVQPEMISLTTKVSDFSATSQVTQDASEKTKKKKLGAKAREQQQRETVRSAQASGEMKKMKKHKQKGNVLQRFQKKK